MTAKTPLKCFLTGGNAVALGEFSAGDFIPVGYGGTGRTDGNNLLPTGGTSGQVLAKTGSGDYAVAWTTPSSGFTNPMTTIGDIIVGGTSGAAQRLANGTAGFVLTAQSGAPPAWVAAPSGGFTNPMTSIGDLIQGGTSGAAQRLAAVATGNVLISGGVTTLSTWGKVGLTTHITGTLPIANGGTGATTLAAVKTALKIPVIYESPQQTITPSGNLTIPHGLGVKPISVTMRAICTTADIGYSIGDTNYGPFSISSSGNDSNSVTIDADTTNIYVYYGSQPNLLLMLNKSSRAGANATSTSWRTIFVAMGIV